MNSQYERFGEGCGRGLVVAAVAALALAGCDALTLDREPEVVHLELDSPDVSRVTLVTSRWFIEVEDPDCPNPGNPECPTRPQPVEADTVLASLPFSQSYPFDFRLQFYAEAYTDPPVEATLFMKVHLDDEEWYNDSRMLTAGGDGEQEKMRFVYQYHHLRLPGG